MFSLATNGKGLYPITTQVKRIRGIREAARLESVALFLNARTDLFLGTDPATHEVFVEEAIKRARAYEEAGADGFFIPGLTQFPLITRIVEAVSLPVNVMMGGNLTSINEVAKYGVARVSYGPTPYRTAMADLSETFKSLS